MKTSTCHLDPLYPYNRKLVLWLKWVMMLTHHFKDRMCQVILFFFEMEKSGMKLISYKIGRKIMVKKDG